MVIARSSDTDTQPLAEKGTKVQMQTSALSLRRPADNYEYSTNLDYVDCVSHQLGVHIYTL
jgi:hypothetical protein